MKQVWVVIRREYVERVRTRAFILSTLGIPLFIIGLMALGFIVALNSQGSASQIALVDFTGQLGKPVAQALERGGYEIEVADPVAGTTGLDQRVLDADLEAYVVLDELTASEAVFTYRAKESPSWTRSRIMRSIIVGEVVDQRLGLLKDGESIRSLLKGGAMEFEHVGIDEADVKEVEAERITGMVTGISGGIILYAMMLIYGAQILQSVLEEKQSRVVELVISSLRPWQLMLGKIVGVGAVGLTQVGIWIGCLVLLAASALTCLIVLLPDLEELGEFMQYLPGPGAIVLLIVYFLLGYFLYSSLFAAVGAMCRNVQEATHAQMPLVILIIVPFVIQILTLEGGGMDWLDWVALFPFFSPIMMYPRAVMGTVPWWMVGASIVLMALTVWGTSWVAGRIYKFGILSQGNRPSLRELVRWVRQT